MKHISTPKHRLKRHYSNKPSPFFGKKKLIILVLVVLTGSATDIIHAQLVSSKPRHIVLSQSKINTPSSQSNTNLYNSSLIKASAIVSSLNAQRTAKGLSKLNWITQLDDAASARADYMITNNTTSNSAGDPSADLTNAGYSPNGWQLSSLTSSEYQNSSLSNIINQFTTGNDSNFGFTSSYSDIGVAVVPYTNNGIGNQEVVVFLANPYTGLSQQQINNYESQLNAPSDSGSSGLSNQQTCGVSQTGVYPNCVNDTCPVDESGTYPDCGQCPFMYTGTYPNCIPPPPPPASCQVITEPDGLSGLSCPTN